MKSGDLEESKERRESRELTVMNAKGKKVYRRSYRQQGEMLRKLTRMRTRTWNRPPCSTVNIICENVLPSTQPHRKLFLGL